MKRRQVMLISSVLVLITLNILRLVSAGHDDARTGVFMARTAGFHEQDFVIVAAADNQSYEARRDLFSSEAISGETGAGGSPGVKASKPARAISPAKSIEPEPVAITPSPEQLEEQAVLVRLTGLKLAGVAFHGDRRAAFLVDPDQRYIVSVGDRIYARFIVTQITADAIELQDQDSPVHKQIRLSGT